MDLKFFNSFLPCRISPLTSCLSSLPSSSLLLSSLAFPATSLTSHFFPIPTGSQVIGALLSLPTALGLHVLSSLKVGSPQISKILFVSNKQLFKSPSNYYFKLSSDPNSLKNNVQKNHDSYKWNLCSRFYLIHIRELVPSQCQKAQAYRVKKSNYRWREKDFLHSGDGSQWKCCWTRQSLRIHQLPAVEKQVQNSSKTMNRLWNPLPKSVYDRQCIVFK